MEYESTLLRELLHLPVSRSVVEEVINFHGAIANRYQILFLWRPFLRDPKDDMVLELALKAGCDYIATDNKRDFAGIDKAFQVRVVDAGEFLRAIGA